MTYLDGDDVIIVTEYKTDGTNPLKYVSNLPEQKLQRDIDFAKLNILVWNCHDGKDLLFSETQYEYIFGNTLELSEIDVKLTTVVKSQIAVAKCCRKQYTKLPTYSNNYAV